MGDSLAGTQTQTTQIPAYLEAGIQNNLSRANDVSNIGYVPYYGADVAAMTPMQNAAIEGTNQAASAFGMPTADPTAGMPQAQDYGGMQAYSSAPLYEGALNQLQQTNPDQYSALNRQYGDINFGSAIGGGSGGSGGSFVNDLLGIGGAALIANKLGVFDTVGGALGLTGGANAANTVGTSGTAINAIQNGSNAIAAGQAAIPTLSGGASGAATLANPNVAFSGLPTFANSALAQGGALAAGSNALAAGSANLAGLSGLGGVSIGSGAPASGLLAGSSAYNPASWGALQNSASQIGTSLGTGTGGAATGTASTGVGSSAGAVLGGLAALAPIAALGAFGVPSGKAHVDALQKDMWDRRLAAFGGLAAIEANDPTPDGMTRMEYNLMKNPNKYATKALTDDELEEQYYYNTGLV